MTGAVILGVVGLMMVLIAFGTPRESGGGVRRPGFLIPWYLLPLLGTAAATRLWPGAARRAWPPLLVGVASLAGWCVVVSVW